MCSLLKINNYMPNTYPRPSLAEITHLQATIRDETSGPSVQALEFKVQSLVFKLRDELKR
jgi:hypothetical protein